MITVSEVNNIPDLNKLNDVWNSLLEKSGSNTIFSTFEWLSIWWEYYGNDKKLFVLLALDGKEVIGIAPLMIEKRRILRFAPLRVVSFIGTGVSDYADFIIEKKREEVLKIFFEYLKKSKRFWDEIELREIKEDSPNLDIISKGLDKWGLSGAIYESGKCPYIKIDGDWSGYLKSLSKNFKQDLRTQYNRIIKKGFTYSFSKKEMETEDSFFSSLINMHLKGIDNKNKISFLKDERGRNFLKQIVRESERKGWITINIMNINDEVAAYDLGFQYENMYYYWNLGRNNRYDIFSPGKLLLHHILEGYFSSGEIDEFDFLRGAEDYKYRWTELARTNYRVSVRSDSLYSRAVHKTSDLYHSVMRKIDGPTRTQVCQV